MKIALQLSLITTGSTVSDRCKWARDHGVDGIELTPQPYDQLRATADEVRKVLPITTICASFDAHGKTVFDLLDPDPQKRRVGVGITKKCLEICGQLGAVGLVVPPIFGPPRVPDLSPFADPIEIEEQLLVSHCRELGPFAASHGTKLLLEPLNRYEQHYLVKQSDGVRVIDKANTVGVGLLSDLFHMNIEETNTPATLTAVAGKYTSSIHLADNTRLEPGTGDIDFVAAFRSLRKAGYEGYMAYECGLSGDSDRQRSGALSKSIAYVHACLDKARG